MRCYMYVLMVAMAGCGWIYSHAKYFANLWEVSFEDRWGALWSNNFITGHVFVQFKKIMLILIDFSYLQLQLLLNAANFIKSFKMCILLLCRDRLQAFSLSNISQKYANKSRVWHSTCEFLAVTRVRETRRCHVLTTMKYNSIAEACIQPTRPCAPFRNVRLHITRANTTFNWELINNEVLPYGWCHVYTLHELLFWE